MDRPGPAQPGDLALEQCHDDAMDATGPTLRTPDPGDVLVAATVAGALSGIPSTVFAILARRSPLEAARAAGALLGKPSLWRGAVAHAAISIVWTWLLAAVLPDRDRPALSAVDGAVAGGAVAALDLGVIGRRVPAIRELPAIPQVADHLAFGAVAALVLDQRRRRRRPFSAT